MLFMEITLPRKTKLIMRKYTKENRLEFKRNLKNRKELSKKHQ
jgi:hypothetical protein